MGYLTDATMLILWPELRGCSICRDFLEPLCILPDLLQSHVRLFASTQVIWKEMQQETLSHKHPQPHFPQILGPVLLSG
jgi:hypothetical protein